MAKPKPCLVNILKIWLRRRMSRIFWPIFLSCMYYPLRVYLTRKFRQDNRINTFELAIPLLGGVRGGSLGREISVNISRVTDLPTPKSPPKRGLSNSTHPRFYEDKFV